MSVSAPLQGGSEYAPTDDKSPNFQLVLREALFGFQFKPLEQETIHSDLAQAAAVILTEQGGDGPSPNLTASEAIDMEEVAAMLSDLVGRPIYPKVVPDEAYREYLIAQGFSAPRIEITMLIKLSLGSGRRRRRFD